MSEIIFQIHQRFPCILYHFQLGNNISVAARHICAALVTGIAVDDICRDCLKRFRESDTSLEDRPTSGHSLHSDIERIKVLIEDNLPLTTGK